jgi:protein-disulfide isomerase
MNSALLLAISVWPASIATGQLTSSQADQILGELRQIRQILEHNAKSAPPSPSDTQPFKANLQLRGSPFVGSENAPLTLVEFTDYQCPFCRRFHFSTFAQLKEKYIDTGVVKFYSLDYPLEFHSFAQQAAEAARCSGDQGHFWDMRDQLQKSDAKLDLPALISLADDLHLDIGTFRACVESEKYKQAIQEDIQKAISSGAGGTPAFVVGRTTPQGVAGELIVGAMPYSVFDEKIKALR